MSATSKIELQCSRHTVIIRNDALKTKLPGGVEAFRNRYRADSNGQITVHCVTNSIIGDTIRGLETMELDQGKDFITIDTVECEMWRIIHSEKVERPFWFETGAEWLRCNHWNGKVVVWYNG